MRTTIILDDELYQKLVQKAIEQYGTSKSLSKLLNALVRRALQQEDTVPASMFGAWKAEAPMDISDLRDEGELH